MIELIGLVATAGASEPLEWHAQAGAEINADSHGIANAGLRKGAWQAELITDTVELRYGPEVPRGRWWTAVRAEFGAAGLLISPWLDGAPDPTRSLLAGYAGVDGGAVRYLPVGLYAGATYHARYWWFAAQKQTVGPIPEGQPILTGDAVVGWHRAWADAWLRAGADFRYQLVSPHAALEVKLAPRWLVAPLVELRVGVADGQDVITRTRLGGLNPYVVPLAGAAWAEWWVEDYAAARAGVSLNAGGIRIAPFVDAAWFDGDSAVGLGVLGRLTSGRLFVDAAFGYAPWIDRQPGVFAGSGFFLVGVDWGRGLDLDADE